MYNSPIVLLKGIQAKFLRGLATSAPSMLAPIIEDATSDSNKEQYVLFNHFGIIKEWLDEIDFSHIQDFEYEIKNKDWQNGFKVDRNTLEDSKKTLGNDVEREINFSLNSWSNFPDKIITELLEAGETGLAFDKIAFFIAGSGRPALQQTGTTIQNLVTGTGTTVAQITADFASATTALRGFKAKNGDPFNANPKWVVIIPPQLEWSFKTIRNSVDIGGSGVTNVYKDSFEIIVNDYLTAGVNDWYVVNTNAPMKPFIFQKRTQPVFDMTDNKEKKFIKYFSTARMNGGYGNPLSIAKVNN
jgi:phage major head subunit gpT-like protein